MFSFLVILGAFYICSINASINKKYPIFIDVKVNYNNNEQFYNNLTDYANSPLVECINL